jgi:hypothetical protein
MLNLAADHLEFRNDRFTVSYTQYDLFGTRASITALASYLDNPGAMRREDPGDRNDWHFRDNITYELIGVVPLGRNDSLRGSWQRSYEPVRYFTMPVPGHLQYNLRSLPAIRKELFWIHDTTDDPLFPTRGTRITAGGTRSDSPTYSFASLGRTKREELKVSLERTWTLTPRQALTTGADGSDGDQKIRRYDGYLRYAFDLRSHGRLNRDSDLRLEVSANRIFTSIQKDPFREESTAGASIVYRNAWGVLRLTGQYVGWRQD